MKGINPPPVWVTYVIVSSVIIGSEGGKEKGKGKSRGGGGNREEKENAPLALA